MEYDEVEIHLPVGLASELHRSIGVRAKDLLQAMLGLHLCPQGRGAEFDGERPLQRNIRQKKHKHLVHGRSEYN
jgi:hypothetical protein